MRILHVSSEFFPILKTGGLADVVAALPPALANYGCESRLLVPGFPAFNQSIIEKKLIAEIYHKFGAALIKIYYGKIPNSDTDIYLIDAPELYDRPGGPYTDSNNYAYYDNYRRFALLSWVGAKLADRLDPLWQPQVIHAHDWHAGLVPAYLKANENYIGHKLASCIFTVHNLAYQGNFSAQVFKELELPDYFLNTNGIEYYSQISFLKAGLFFADKITTVSPTYAREIQTKEQGCGFEGLLSARSNDLTGILNGVDTNIWNPATDKLIANNYTYRTVSGKLKCKTALQEQTGLKVQNNLPLFVIVSRLTEQKGFNLVLEAIGEIINRGGQLVILGSGDPAIENSFKTIAAAHPNEVAVQIGYDEEQAHCIIASGDIILVPSLFEPCGLTQLYGMGYGTLPLVHKVGGLADTVIDCSLENLADNSATGFVFEKFELEYFIAAIRRAFVLYSRKAEWKRVQKQAMKQEFSWDKAAKQYFTIYEEII